MRDVVAIGSTVNDVFWHTDFSLADDASVPSGKVLSIPFGEKFGVRTIHGSLGGNAANASVTFARQGIDVSLFTRIGNDSIGKDVVRSLKREGVGTRLIERSGTLPTAQSVLLLQDGERSILTYHGAINEFTLDRVALSSLRAKWWYVSLPGDSYRLFDRLLSYARSHNIRIAYNPSFSHLQGEGKKDLLRHLQDISVLFLNAGEAAQLTDIPFEQEERVFGTLDAMIPGIAVVTNGNKGAVVSDGSHIYRCGIFPETALVDRTGAGDAFGSGFISGLIQNKESCEKGSCNPDAIVYALRLASANATSVVENIGAIEGIVTKQSFKNDERWQQLDISVE